MPSYEFMCESCIKPFSLVLRLEEHEKKNYACPHCKSRDVKQQISLFQTKTCRKGWKRKPDEGVIFAGSFCPEAGR
jgi:putative FmdB family regulatory protein